MKRWAAITALALTAIPAATVMGGVIVAIVESAKIRPMVEADCARAQVHVHGCIRPAAMLSVESSWIAGVIALAVFVAWWLCWYWLLRRSAPDKTRSLALTPNALLATWLVGLTLWVWYSVTSDFTWM